MDIHKNASLTPRGREELVRRVVVEGQTPSAVATALGVCDRTVRKWVARFAAEGRSGLVDRSSRPRRSPRRTPAPVEARVAELRRQRWTGAEIARQVGCSKATVHRILRRLGLHRLKALEPAEPVRRYEHDAPGDMIHIDIKKLGRFAKAGHRVTGHHSKHPRNQGIGWEFVHVCIDDASRIAFSRILPDEKNESAVAFLEAALVYYTSLGIQVRRVMTDNGSCYKSQAFRDACRRLGLKHVRTRPYTPKTNGKAERFIQTALCEWAYARA